MTGGELNPFVYDDPLPPDQLVDREPETAQLLGLAEGGHNTRLQAPRRYGKTTLLGKVRSRADLETFDRAIAAIDRETSEAFERLYRRLPFGASQRMACPVTSAIRS